MIGVILAAGRGSRLGEETATLPKPLMTVAGRTCIDFAIEALLAVVDEVLVVTGYRAELVEAHLAAKWRGRRLTAVLNPQPEAGNLTSLGAARPFLNNAPFIVTNADHLFPVAMYSRHFPPTTGSSIRIACERERPVLADEMKVIEAQGRLTAISKSLPRYDGAYIGTTCVPALVQHTYWAAFDRVSATHDQATASVEMVLHELAQDSATAPRVCWLSGLDWFEVDTPEDLVAARLGLALRPVAS